MSGKPQPRRCKPKDRSRASAQQALPTGKSRKTTIAIASPKNGDTVDRKFDVSVELAGFHPSCDLEGRANISSYGHLHIFVTQAGVTDTTAMPPMVAMLQTSNGKVLAEKLSKETGMSMDQLTSMASMRMVGLQGMPCTTTIPVDLSTWHSGPARVTVMLARDDHDAVPGVAQAAVNVTLK